MRKQMSMGAVLTAFVATIGFSGCYSTPVMPPTGIIYNNTKAPMATAGNEFGDKMGTASVTSAFGIASWGDCSAQAAAKSAGISEVKFLDYQFSNILGWQVFTTVVYGD